MPTFTWDSCHAQSSRTMAPKDIALSLSSWTQSTFPLSVLISLSLLLQVDYGTVCYSLFFLTNWSYLFYSHICCLSVTSDSMWSLVSDPETTNWLHSSSTTFTSTPYPEIQKKENTQSLSFIKWGWLLLCSRDENNKTDIFFGRIKPILSLFSCPNYPRKAPLISLPYFITRCLSLIMLYFLLLLAVSSPPLSLFPSLRGSPFSHFPLLAANEVEKLEEVVLSSLRSSVHSMKWSSVYTWSSALLSAVWWRRMILSQAHRYANTGLSWASNS